MSGWAVPGYSRSQPTGSFFHRPTTSPVQERALAKRIRSGMLLRPEAVEGRRKVITRGRAENRNAPHLDYARPPRRRSPRA